jgi:quinol monooxygenase YgiN
MIHVVATIALHPGVRKRFLAEFLRITPLVRAEDGCIEYQATIDVQSSLSAQIALREDVVTVVEKWASLDALAAHSQAPHMADYRTNVKDYVKSVSLQVLEPVLSAE